MSNHGASSSAPIPGGPRRPLWPEATRAAAPISPKSIGRLPAVWAASTSTGTGDTAFATSATGNTEPVTLEAWVMITSEVGARVTLATISSAVGTPSDDDLVGGRHAVR